MSIICGVDEAGRGPIIGPLVMVAATIEEHEEYRLKELGVKDSKQLTPAQRERIFAQLEELEKEGILHYATKSIPPEQIDVAVNGNTTNLNYLEADTSLLLVNGLLQQIKIGSVYVDCPSPNIKAYKAYLRERIAEPIEIIAEHKADENYLIVSAASILAKVLRDRAIEAIKAEIGMDFGSGYLTDPQTQEFLNNHAEKFNLIFRKSWISYRRVINNKNQKKLKEF